MSEQQNLEVVRKGYEAFGRGDINALLSLFDENIEWVSPGPPEVPTAGTRRGLQAVGEFFKTLNELLEFTRFDAKEFVAQGDRVIVLGEDTARVKATGKVLEGAWAHVFTLKNGKVVSFQEYSDMSPMVAELRAAAARA
jgi:ketosteroid isomerase-like protein